MKKFSIIFLSTISLLTENLLISAVCIILVFYLIYKWDIKKNKKVDRTECSFQKLINNDCICDAPCNEYCYEKLKDVYKGDTPKK